MSGSILRGAVRKKKKKERKKQVTNTEQNRYGTCSWKKVVNLSGLLLKICDGIVEAVISIHVTHFNQHRFTTMLSGCDYLIPLDQVKRGILVPIISQ